MSRHRRTFAFLALGVGLALIPRAARAYDGHGSGSYDWRLPSRMPLRTGNLPTPPYFAMHPPVYYEGLVRRPYGDSPFAYRPTRPRAPSPLPRATSAPKPAIIENPFYSAPSGQSSGTQASTSRAKMIVNPFYRLPASREQVVSNH